MGPFIGSIIFNNGGGLTWADIDQRCIGRIEANWPDKSPVSVSMHPPRHHQVDLPPLEPDRIFRGVDRNNPAASSVSPSSESGRGQHAHVRVVKRTDIGLIIPYR